MRQVNLVNGKETEKMEGMQDMTEKEMQSVKMSTLYELRLIFTQGEKKEYTTEEIVELLDKIATAKDQERQDHPYHPVRKNV